MSVDAGSGLRIGMAKALRHHIHVLASIEKPRGMGMP